jgi:hypothetical protein
MPEASSLRSVIYTVKIPLLATKSEPTPRKKPGNLPGFLLR